jgi:hypothetical protein
MTHKIIIILIFFLFNLIFNISYATAKPKYYQEEYIITLNYLNNLHSTHNNNISIKSNFLIIINTKLQKLFLYNSKGIFLKSFMISSSKKGLGALLGSKKTPQGLHRIIQKFGDNIPNYGIFNKRKFTNKIWPKSIYKTKHHKKDFIITRILRLEGLETGVNKGKNIKGQTVDSLERGIYIHGTTMEWKLGTPSTIGCIHLSSNDIVELFNIVPINSLVMIY